MSDLFTQTAPETGEANISAKGVEIVVGGRKAWVFRRLVKGQRQPTYSVKGKAPGRKQFFRNTGFTTLERALPKARMLWTAELNAHLDGVKEALDATRLRKERAPARIGEIITAFEAAVADRRVVIAARTAASYVSALRRMVAWAMGWHDQVDGQRRERIDAGRVDGASSGILTEEMVRTFARRYEAAVVGDFTAEDRRLRGAHAVLINARAMFEPEVARVAYGDLTLPELTGFRAVQLREAAEVELPPLEDATVAKIAQAALALKTTNPPLYLVHLLFRHGGLRNREILEGRVEWLERLKPAVEIQVRGGETETVTLVDGSTLEVVRAAALVRRAAAKLVVKRRPYFVPKRSGGEVALSAEVLAELEPFLESKEPLDFLVPAATETARYELIYRRHADFMRPWTRGHDKRSYELRSWGAGVIERLQGIEMADLFLRHAKKRTSERSYLRTRPLPAPITLADCGIVPDCP